jgi:LPS export ABC transporter protein LptC
MTSLKANKPKRRRLFFAACLIIAVGIAAAVYFGQRRLPLPWLLAASVKPGTQGMTVTGIHQSATHEGRTEWILDAVAGEYRLSEKKILLNELTVTYFPKDGPQVWLTAKRGELDTDTHDMEAYEDVVVRNDVYRLETDKICYRHEPRLIETDTRSTITSRSGEISGDSLSIDLNTNQMIMEGNVQSSLVYDAAPHSE